MAWFLTRSGRSDKRLFGRQRKRSASFRPYVEHLEDRTLLSLTITGTVFKDSTGNGFSSDDGPMKGAAIALFNSLTSTGRGAVATTTTDDHGGYTFTVLTPGTYYVEELVPSGYIQTGGSGQSGQLGTYYTISGQPGKSYANNNFIVYQVPAGRLTNVSYTVAAPGGKSTTVADLSGHTLPGDMVTVRFTIPASAPSTQLTLVTYTATGPTFTASNAPQQRIFDEASGVFAPGKTYSMTVQIPTGYYQIDFVRGPAISQFLPPSAGPDKGNITYHSQNRFITGDNGGGQILPTPHVQQNDIGTLVFWNTPAQGQTLINELNGGPNATSLGKWLASNFPHLFGTLADPKNAQEKNLTGFTNTQVGAFFKGLYAANPTYAEIMAVALSVYATDSGLAGGSYAKVFGLNVTANGSGVDILGVGSAGTILGFTKNSTQTVLSIVHGVDQLASDPATLKANLPNLKALFDGITTGVGAS